MGDGNVSWEEGGVFAVILLTVWETSIMVASTSILYFELKFPAQTTRAKNGIRRNKYI